MPWALRVTVAAVIERDGRFLMVEEVADSRLVLNQPAGHLDEGESLVQAARRETLEETAWHFRPEAVIGLYRWPRPDRAMTFLRIGFSGALETHEPDQPLDEGIRRAVWLTVEELEARRERLRSPMVLACVRDYLAGRRYPLELLVDLGSGGHPDAQPGP
ncbi:MAG: NUDIX hydrolase [Gammaproteobacteria bacterium]|nr:NUDIX hydrolase [Gammaproteobacteria bacterium]